jgi:hypothetical protein
MSPVSADLNPDLSRVLRTLAAPSLGSAVESRAGRDSPAMIGREALTLSSSAISYRIVPVTHVHGETIGTGEATLCAPGLAAQSGELRAVAAAACTLGTAIQERVSALFAARQPSHALALDMAGNQLLFRLAHRTVAAIRGEARRKGLGLGIEASPGDPGVPLCQQATVLALANAARIGISATETGMLSPLKSLSFLVALGPNLRKRAAPGRCSCCPSRDRCTVK